MGTINVFVFQGSEEPEAAASDTQNQCFASGKET